MSGMVKGKRGESEDWTDRIYARFIKNVRGASFTHLVSYSHSVADGSSLCYTTLHPTTLKSRINTRSMSSLYPKRPPDGALDRLRHQRVARRLRHKSMERGMGVRSVVRRRNQLLQ